MRILLVSEDIPYPNMGGLAKHVLNLARALVRAGHEVDLLGGDQHPIEVAGEEGRFGGRFFGELSGHTAGWKEIGLGMYLPPKRSVQARRFARAILRRADGYDVVHYHGHLPNVARYIPASVNFVQTRHDHGSECIQNTRFRDGAVCTSTDPADCAGCRANAPNAIQRSVSAMAVARYRREVAEAFRRHKTIFVSDMLRRNFARTSGPGPWGTVVHNFIDIGRLEDARREAAAMPHEDGFHVFIAGKLYAAKGIEAFLREIAPRLPAHMRIAIAGDGGDAERLTAAYSSDRIRFLGWCAPERTLAMAARADAVVVPSIWEDPCPSTIFEGLLLGKPTFALARGGTPELAGYASAPDQLRLHDTMAALVDDLVAYDPARRFDLPDQQAGSADHAARRLLEIYRMPAGPLTA